MTHKKPSQAQQVLDHIWEKGGITTITACYWYGCTRLSARIYELKAQGYNIKTRPVKTRKGARVAEYYLADNVP